MKLITITILLFSCVLINTKLENKNSEKSKQIFNAAPDSVTYGYATNDVGVLQSAAGFISPQIMEKIPINLNHPYTGIMGEATGVNFIYFNIYSISLINFTMMEEII